MIKKALKGRFSKLLQKISSIGVREKETKNLEGQKLERKF